MNHYVRAISFLDDSVVIEFTSADDIRSNGLAMQHALSIPATDEYAERLDELVTNVQDLLVAALEDNKTYPALVDVPEDDEDEVSPYDNPSERVLPPPPEIQD